MTGPVALIDYGAGNLQSVKNALKAAGAENMCVTNDPAEVLSADRIVLPGVGAFAHCMGALSAIPGMVDALNEATGPGAKPFLGICVGMQLMAEAGEEHGRHAGLGWIKGTVRLIETTDATVKIPHMGWNQVRQDRDHPLWHGIPDMSSFYFVHSYYVSASDPEDTVGSTNYGGWFTSAVARDNIFATQFHPEKSAQYGLKLYQNFVAWRP